MLWTKEMFNNEKPIIAMCHLHPIPTDPLFNKTLGVDYIVEEAINDINILQNEGVHGILISNEFSYPYTQKLSQIAVATMARVIGEIKSIIKVPFGVDCMYDSFSTIDLAIATEADFYRITLPKATTYEYEYGKTQIGDLMRYATSNGLSRAKKVININYSINSLLTSDDIEKLIKTIITQVQPDALCLSSNSIKNTCSDLLSLCCKVKEPVALFCDGGCNENNIKNITSQINGIIIGTALKENQDITNHISQMNVRNFMGAYYSSV